MHIRKMALQDIDQIATLCKQFGYPAQSEQISERFVRISQSSEHQLFVADIDEGVIGWVHVHGVHSLGSDSYVEIRGIVVDGARRQQGVGRQLMEQAEQWGRDNGYSMVRLRSSTERPEAHHFYPKLGYECVKSQYLYTKMLDKSKQPTATDDVDGGSP